jgi:hypothetical protein
MEHKKVNQPKFDLVLGGVCTGKSRFIRENYKSGYTHIDAAEIFIKLSKGKYYDFPSTLETEMDKIGFDKTNKAIGERANIVMEFIGDDEPQVSKLLDELKSIDYEINIQAIDCDFDLAMERNINRGDDNISAYYTQPYHYKWLTHAIKNFKKEGKRTK